MIRFWEICFDTLNTFKHLHSQMITKPFMQSYWMKCATQWFTVWEIAGTLVYGRFSCALFSVFGMRFVVVNVALTPSALGSTFWNVLTCFGVRFPAGRRGPWLSMPMLKSVSLRPGCAQIRESVGDKKRKNSWFFKKYLNLIGKNWEIKTKTDKDKNMDDWAFNTQTGYSHGVICAWKSNKRLLINK